MKRRMGEVVKGGKQANDVSAARANLLCSKVIDLAPRFLTQMDRDPDSPTFGCFDRNYWHYKIRDFSSAILQQGILALDALDELKWPGNPVSAVPVAQDWILACARCWASLQLRGGGFNEYYPFEEGYPPTAFGLYAVALAARKRTAIAGDPRVHSAIQKACNWVLGTMKPKR